MASVTYGSNIDQNELQPKLFPNITKLLLLLMTLYLNLQHTTDILDEALHWLDGTGEPNIRRRIMKFGSTYTCFKALHFILTQCKIPSHTDFFAPEHFSNGISAFATGTSKT